MQSTGKMILNQLHSKTMKNNKYYFPNNHVWANVCQSHFTLVVILINLTLRDVLFVILAEDVLFVRK